MRKKLGVFLCIALIGLSLIGCADKESDIRDYKINFVTATGGLEAAEFLQDVLKEKHDVKIGTTKDVSRDKQIYLMKDPVMAATMEDAFSIRNVDGSLYLSAADEEGLQRAISYFAYFLVGEDGSILLKNGESYADTGSVLKNVVTIGEVPIEKYVITYAGKEAEESCKELQFYIQQTCGKSLKAVAEKDAGDYNISLSVDEGREPGTKEISIRNKQVEIVASDEELLKEAVYLFVNTYLGWMNAGEADAHLSNTASVINIPADVMEEEPWIAAREAIIVLWNINYNRGFYLNGDTTLENNLLDYSEEQLYEYVKMLKYCGFNGIQITEMCSAWAGAGGYEAAHETIRTLAEAAHSLDMTVTIWVWGAEFTGYGWVDNTVTYSKAEYDFAYQNPEVVATFEKYYSIYAELADCCDRLIGHFYDPGNLNTAEDIAYFTKMLRDKFQAVNPEIDFGISCWVDVYDKNVFLRELGNDITLYECGHHDNESDYTTFRGFVTNSGARLGTWAWNTCEMEIDQLAQMNFNLDIIRSVYQTAKHYDSVCKPSYWSEMDSYHVLNVFSLYCAGQMLINPDIESEVLLARISEATVGAEYAPAFAELLDIIQDARSGSSWDTYFWSKENYILKSASYPAEDILNRCNTYIPILDEMIEKEIETNTLPLPISLNQLLKMMRPHLEQIKDYAEFRIALADLEAEYVQGVATDVIAQKLYEIGYPIDSYNCIIGTWGQIEARAQREMVMDFCSRTGVTVPVYSHYDKIRKDFIYAQFAMYQRGKAEPNCIGSPYYQYGFAYGEDETSRLVEEMIADGLFIRSEAGSVYMKDWENYRYHFN